MGAILLLWARHKKFLSYTRRVSACAPIDLFISPNRVNKNACHKIARCVRVLRSSSLAFDSFAAAVSLSARVHVQNDLTNDECENLLFALLIGWVGYPRRVSYIERDCSQMFVIIKKKSFYNYF